MALGHNLGGTQGGCWVAPKPRLGGTQGGVGRHPNRVWVAPKLNLGGIREAVGYSADMRKPP